MSQTFLYHEDCPKCKSSDNVGVWENDDGSLSKFCFTPGCDFREGKPPNQEDYENIPLSPIQLPEIS